MLFKTSSITVVLGLLTIGAAQAATQGRGQPPPHPTTPAKPAGPPSTPAASPAASTKPSSAQTHLLKQPQLAANLQALLPTTLNVNDAAAGFSNLGHFVSAVHVSRNLGIPFVDLKAKVTGPNAESLGRAIQDLKPAANADAEVKKAEAQAKDDLKKAGG